MSDVKWRAQCATMTQISYVYVCGCVYMSFHCTYSWTDWLTCRHTENIDRKSDFISTSRVCSAMQFNQSHKPLPKQGNNTCFTLTLITHTSLPSSYCVSGVQPSVSSPVFKLLYIHVLISSENKLSHTVHMILFSKYEFTWNMYSSLTVQ